MLTKGIIDRFEGDYVVIELKDLAFIDLPVKLLPTGAKEGDFIEINIEINKKETDNQKEKIQNLLNKLSNKNS